MYFQASFLAGAATMLMVLYRPTLDVSAFMAWIALEWSRALPLVDELRSWEALLYVTDLEVPVIVTKGIELTDLERDRAVLEIKASDPGTRIAAKALERRLAKQPYFAVSNPCAEDEVFGLCEPKSKAALTNADALVLRCENISWVSKGSSSSKPWWQRLRQKQDKVTLVGRFLERGQLTKVHAPLEGSSSLWFASLKEHRVGDVVLRKRDDRRGIVLFVEWPPKKPRKDPMEKILKTAMKGLSALTRNKVHFVTIKPPVIMEAPSYVVIVDDRLEIWSHDGVFRSAIHPRPPMLLEANVRLQLEENPTAASKVNSDRDYTLGEGWASLLRSCDRGACFLVRAPHKAVRATSLAKLAVHGPATLYLATSAKAPKPPGDFHLQTTAFTSHGCCPPAKLDLYRRLIPGPGVVNLPNHGLVADGSESHTYIFLLELTEEETTPPLVRHPLLDTFFLSSDELTGNSVRPDPGLYDRRRILAHNISAPPPIHYHRYSP